MVGHRTVTLILFLPRVIINTSLADYLRTDWRLVQLQCARCRILSAVINRFRLCHGSLRTTKARGQGKIFTGIRPVAVCVLYLSNSIVKCVEMLKQ